MTIQIEKFVLNRDSPACPRCMTPSRDADGDHDPSKMIAWDYCREPRDLEHTKRVLIECADMTSRSAADNHASRLGIWPEVPAAMGLTHFNIYLQVVSDSMHVWDGGLTERVLVYVACWIYKKAEDQAPQTGWPAVHQINCRLAATERHQEFRHFNHPLFKLNDETRTSGRPDKRIVKAANWRCEEWADVLPQFPYLIAEYPPVARVVIAYTNLYNTMRAVAPTLKCVATAMRQYATEPNPKQFLICIVKHDFSRFNCDLERIVTT